MDLRLLVVLVVICGSAHAQTCTDKISGCSFIFCRFFASVKIQCPKTCGGCPTGPTSPPTPDPNPTPSGFNVWSACSKTCGSGSRYRVRTCSLNDINRCPREYEDCNNNECQQKTCEGSTQQNYGDKSQCCSNNAVSPCGRNWLMSRRRKRSFMANARQASSRNARILVVGGDDAAIRQWPWVIRIEIMVSGAPNMVCGGTLIHRQWILTAAHCVSEAKIPLTTVYVGYGTIHQVLPQIHRVIQHREFVNYGGYSVNDIALVQLTAPVSTNEHVYPVCLPRGELTPTDKHCYVIGWGSVFMSGPHAAIDTLQEGRIRTLPFDVCKNAYNSQTNNIMDENMMKCAGIIAGGVSSCVGDSGGPLLCQRCKSCDWYLSGLVSFGSTICAVANKPGVFTNVVNFEEWIRGHVPQLQSNSYSCN